MQPAHGYQAAFPPTIDGVPEDARVIETFPFTPGALSIGSVLALAGFFVGAATHGGPRKTEDLYLPLGCVAGALLFGFWEIWRRTHRTAVAFQGAQIGIYRAGKLEEVAYRSQIAIYQLNIINTIRELFAFGILALFGVGFGLASLGTNLEFGLMGLGAGIGMGGAFISSLYARIGCRHFFVPKGNGTEQVMFTRGGIGRFGI